MEYQTKPFYPFTKLYDQAMVHQADASTLLRQSQQVIDYTDRAWCGGSLTERGSGTRFSNKTKRSTRSPYRPLPLNPLSPFPFRYLFGGESTWGIR